LLNTVFEYERFEKVSASCKEINKTWGIVFRSDVTTWLLAFPIMEITARKDVRHGGC